MGVDTVLAVEAAAAIIGARFPAINCEGLRHLGSGCEFDAFLTTDGWVFRFPRHADAAQLFEPERRVHSLASAVLPAGIAVPRVELVGKPTPGFPYTFAGHRYIAGVAVDALDPACSRALASDIAAVLGSIHSIPEEAARAAGVREVYADEPGRKEWLDHGIDTVSRLGGVDSAVDVALRWLERVSLPLARFEGPLRFIHQDLAPEHLIADPATARLAGVLDWTDATLGDPARDFVFLVTWRGWAFAEQVLVAYPHPTDPAFRERLRTMARLLSLLWLATAHEHGGDAAKAIAGVRHAFAAEHDSWTP